MPSPERHVIQGVGKLQFGPQSDTFCQALAIVLDSLGEKGIEYQDILCGSGRAFRICWDTRLFLWEKFMSQAHPDELAYLRTDYASAGHAADAVGYEHEIVANTDCTHPEQSDAIDRHEAADTIRRLVVSSISDDGHPVIALLSASPARWAPEWSLITGYDDAGGIITGWSCFQDFPQETSEMEFEPSGYFRKRDWERDTPVLFRLAGKKQDDELLEQRVLEQGVELSREATTAERAWGLAAYDAWAHAVEEDEHFAEAADSVIKGRLEYHTHFVGHLASQKWYTSVYLRDMRKKGWNVSDVLHASANYARIHELMWDCWKVAGGYWRDSDAELSKFREGSSRAQIAKIIRAAGSADEMAMAHLGSALEAWNKTHRYYLES
jgi:hypothetical protein